MKFEHTSLLWLLLVLPPALLAFFWWAWRERQRLVRLFIDVRLLPSLAVGVSAARWKVRVALLAAAVACLVIAVARPQWGFTLEEARQRGLDIVVAMDTSKSMLAEDVSPNRLARAKLAAMDLMQQARSDRLGLVAFAGSAFLQCPLTLDDSAFRQSLEALNVQIISQGGTALAEAITTALAAFGKSEGDNYKVLVIFSDGEDHDEGAVEAAKRAAREGMIIFTVGLGTPEGELLRIKDAKGRSDFIRDDQGAVVKSRLNEALLQQIAAAANGFYLRLSGAKTMEVLYDRGLAPLPRSEKTTKQIRRYHEQYHWPLAVAVLLLVVEMLLPERRRELPTARKTPARRAATAAAAALLLIAAGSAARGSPSAALREYKAGRFEEAMREYRALATADTNDLRLRFNTGVSAYQAKKYDEAVRALTNVLTAPDLALQEQAYYNLGNSFYRMGEQIPVPEIPEAYTAQGPVSATNLPPGALEAIQRKIALWENSLTNFAGTKKLNELDADAKNNHDFVKRQLVELKKKLPPPPPQQQQSKDDKQDKKDDQDQKDQQQQQAKNDPQQKQDSKPDEQKDSQQQQQQQAQQDQKPEEKKDQQAQSQPPQPEKKDQPPQQAQGGQPPKGDEKKDAHQAAPAKPGEMTAQQAQQLLESLKQDEQMLWFKPTSEKPPPPPGRPVKDW